MASIKCTMIKEIFFDLLLFQVKEHSCLWSKPSSITDKKEIITRGTREKKEGKPTKNQPRGASSTRFDLIICS